MSNSAPVIARHMAQRHWNAGVVASTLKARTVVNALNFASILRSIEQLLKRHEYVNSILVISGEHIQVCDVRRFRVVHLRHFQSLYSLLRIER